MRTLQIINDQCRTFEVRLIETGMSYGRDNCLTHDKEDALVEFHDTSGKFVQFVSRYYRSALVEGQRNAGLCLDGGIPEWQVSRQNMHDVVAWLQAA